MIPWVDWLVIAWFIFCWGGYTFFADRQSATKPSLLVSMRIYRREWFKLALGHDNRIGDISALNSLLTGATFFASTSLLILGGLCALFGTTERVIDVAADLPFARRESAVVWMLKIILLIVVFVNAFFKFTWSIRQYQFCIVMMGSAPQTKQPEEHEDFVDALTSLASLAAENSNHGLRAFYFALAALTWFIHPWLFMAASAFVALLLYRREFHSKALKALIIPSQINKSLHLP